MPRAAIDIGSNSILLTIVADDGAILHDEARVVGLGKGLGDRGLFAPDRIAAATAVIGEYAAVAKEHGIDPIAIRAVATSAARRAMNAETVFERFHKNHGVRVRIITGDDEARLTWLGAQRDLLLPDGAQLVVDLGGGSTELVLAEGGEMVRRASLELGSARLTERFVPPSPTDGRIDPAGVPRMQAYVEAEVARFSFEPQPRTVIGVAGTVTTLAALDLGLTAYDAEKVHGSTLSASALEAFVPRWQGLDREERVANVPFSPGRADFLLAGAVILTEVLAAARCDAMRVSDRGLRFGVLRDRWSA